MTLEYLKNFLFIQEYPIEFQNEILDIFDTVMNNDIAKRQLETIEDSYKKDIHYSFKDLLIKTEEISKVTNIDLYSYRLIVLISLTEILKEYYIKNNISLDIWNNTVKDILYKVKECKLCYGRCGISTRGWYEGFYQLKRFTFGRLQFELGKFDRTYQNSIVKVKQGDYVLNVHIPRTETKLLKEEVDESYKSASEFFFKYFDKGYVAFTCHSWLLYPTTVEFAGKDSNIAKFASNYDLFESGDNSDYNEIWRLFDTLYDGDPNHLPNNTSLRRKYIEHIKSHKPFGYGYGIYIYFK